MVSQNGTKSASVRAVIKVLRPCSSELKFNFVLTLTSHQEIVFIIDDADIIATAADNNRGGAPSGTRH
jgi:hypothetical protein